MRKLFSLIMLFPLFALGQNGQPGNPTNKQTNKPTKAKLGFGLKAGVNFANVTSASSINSSNKTGFMVGAFMSPPARGLFSYRMELVYSKQGYDFKTNTNTGTVDMNYILLPTLTGINIGKFAQLQFGAQTAYLLNAKADSSSGTDPNSNPYGSLMQYQNRFNFGAAVGLEIYPFKGILIGARYNVSFGDMYKAASSYTTTRPSFLPSIDAKNNVVQLFLGYRF
jgi:Outer membrane protein beta-barrel domain